MALFQQMFVLSLVFVFGFLTYDHIHGNDRYLKPWAYKAKIAATNNTVPGSTSGTAARNQAGSSGSLRQVANAQNGLANPQIEETLSPEEKMGRDLKRAQDAMKEHQQALKQLTQD
jgi:hypothetical protein